MSGHIRSLKSKWPSLLTLASVLLQTLMESFKKPAPAAAEPHTSELAVIEQEITGPELDGTLWMEGQARWVRRRTKTQHA